MYSRKSLVHRSFNTSYKTSRRGRTEPLSISNLQLHDGHFAIEVCFRELEACFDSKTSKQEQFVSQDQELA